MIDRGQKSVSTLRWVKKAVEHGYAECLNGNHELNLLNNDAKHGSGWWFHDELRHELSIYGVVEEVLDYERPNLVAFLKSLPLVITTPSLRLVHAMWHGPSVEALMNRSYEHFDFFHQKIAEEHHSLRNDYLKEQKDFHHQIIDEHRTPPKLPATERYNLIYQNEHPFRTLTSGFEVAAPRPFYASGKWRVTSRSPWWTGYTDATPVIVGHYWRDWQPRGSHEVFGDVGPYEWLGPMQNVFCIDYSIGKKYRSRRGHIEHTALVALRYPEYTLMNDRGVTIPLEQPHAY